jgi:transcriptional regulator with PAS, ATPase and Fis domain
MEPMTPGLQFIGASRAIRDVKQMLPSVSTCDATVLITGETGTGKEILARTIHELSHRSNKPFVTINCGGLPKDLIESELFGHKRGAYSQAFENREGLVEATSGGTLFLDEIDSLPLDAQPKLLRLLQEKEYRIVGDNRIQKVDLRFIAATITNLADSVTKRSFRADLFYRLSIFNLRLSPLRDRKDDIPHLTDHFVKRYGRRYGKENLKVSEEVVAHLMSYDWPGNIRELEHAVHRAVLWCCEKELQLAHFDLPIYELKPDLQDWNQPYHHLKKQILDSFEAAYISKLLKRHRGNVTSAACSARLNRRTFQRLMVKHGINHTV